VSYVPISLDHALERLAQGHAVYVGCPACGSHHCYTSLEGFAQAIVEHGLKWKLSNLPFYVRELA
jgi:hypothetical protein